MTDHLHNYSVPVPGEPHSRCCESCGERQVYRPPTGAPKEFPYVMMVKKDTLRTLLDYAEGALGERGFDPAEDAAVADARKMLD